MLLSSYTHLGGQHTDSAALSNALRQAGVVAPHSRRPYSEAMIVGLGGGIGFSYFVYEQRAALARLELDSRFRGRGTSFLDSVLARTGVQASSVQTYSTRRAQDALLSVLEAGRAAICIVDPPLLPHRGLPSAQRGRSSQLISVIGAEGGDVFIDDLCAHPVPLSLEQLSAARQSCRRARQRMVTISPPLHPFDLSVSVRQALRSTCRLFLNPHVSNVGFSGLEKWSSLLTNVNNRRGWPRLFSGSSALFSALNHTFTHLHFERTAPGALRPMFADFLEEAAEILGRRLLMRVAAQYRQSAELWGQLTDLALPIDDPVLWRCRAISEERRRLLRTVGAGATVRMKRLGAEVESLGRRFSPSWSDADRLFRFRAMARILCCIRSVERAAISMLWRVVE